MEAGRLSERNRWFLPQTCLSWHRLWSLSYDIHLFHWFIGDWDDVIRDDIRARRRAPWHRWTAARLRRGAPRAAVINRMLTISADAAIHTSFTILRRWIIPLMMQLCTVKSSTALARRRMPRWFWIKNDVLNKRPMSIIYYILSVITRLSLQHTHNILFTINEIISL